MEITLIILQLLTILEVGFKDYISAYFKKKGETSLPRKTSKRLRTRLKV